MKKKEKPQFVIIAILALAKFLDRLTKLVSAITKYFPFSLLPDHYYVHYKNRDVLKSLDYLTAAWLKTGPYFNVLSVDKESSSFIFFKGTFRDKPPSAKVKNFMKFLEKKIGTGNVFLKKDNPNDTILFNKEAIMNQLQS